MNHQGSKMRLDLRTPVENWRRHGCKTDSVSGERKKWLGVDKISRVRWRTQAGTGKRSLKALGWHAPSCALHARAGQHSQDTLWNNIMQSLTSSTQDLLTSRLSGISVGLKFHSHLLSCCMLQVLKVKEQRMGLA